MSDLLCIATIALAGLAQATLQMNLGGLILLYQASMGKHYRRKTRHLARSYILGTCAICFLAICACGYLIPTIFGARLSVEQLVILVGILMGGALVMWLLYYRKGQNTELWIPRSFAQFIIKRAKNTDDSIEAFSLGTLSSLAELPLSLMLCVVAANAILGLDINYQLPAIAAYIVIVAVPMLCLKFRIRTGSNVIAAQKWRIKNKAFARIISGSSFMALGLFVLAFWVIK